MSNYLRLITHLSFEPKIQGPLLRWQRKFMDPRASVLIVDDDPVHLKIYGWIIEAAGYRALAAQVQYAGVDLPQERADVVLLDYNFAGQTTAVEIAREIKARLPGVPVIVLSEALMLPEDIAPLVQGFVRKGDPAKLVEALHHRLSPAP